MWRPPWLAWLVGVGSVRAWSFVRAFGLCPGIWGCPGVQAVATVRCVVFESVRAWASVRAGQPPRRSRHVRAKHLVRVSGHDASSERFYLCPGEWDCPFVRAMGMSGPKNAVRATQFVRARKRLARVDARHQRLDNFFAGPAGDQVVASGSGFVRAPPHGHVEMPGHLKGSRCMVSGRRWVSGAWTSVRGMDTVYWPVFVRKTENNGLNLPPRAWSIMEQHLCSIGGTSAMQPKIF